MSSLPAARNESAARLPASSFTTEQAMAGAVLISGVAPASSLH